MKRIYLIVLLIALTPESSHPANFIAERAKECRAWLSVRVGVPRYLRRAFHDPSKVNIFMIEGRHLVYSKLIGKERYAIVATGPFYEAQVGDLVFTNGKRKYFVITEVYAVPFKVQAEGAFHRWDVIDIEPDLVDLMKKQDVTISSGWLAISAMFREAQEALPELPAKMNLFRKYTRE